MNVAAESRALPAAAAAISTGAMNHFSSNKHATPAPFRDKTERHTYDDERQRLHTSGMR
jgi:hypothetical protein